MLKPKQSGVYIDKTGKIVRVKRTTRAAPAPLWAPYLTSTMVKPKWIPPKLGLLKKWRLECGFTQAEAAYRLGKGRKTYRRWEIGERPIPYDAWMACRVLWLQCDVGQRWFLDACDGKYKPLKALIAYFEATDFKIKPRETEAKSDAQR